MERFTRALRLRWLWYKWKQPERTWANLDVPCDKADRDLFNASTVVTIGNGEKALFWASSWINGTTAKSIAPKLYTKAKRKKITVKQGMTNRKWIDHIFPPTSAEVVREFINLWEATNSVQLNEIVEDELRYGDGHRMGITPLRVHIKFSLSEFFLELKSQPSGGPKQSTNVIYSQWTLLHKRILTTNNLMKRGSTDDTDCRLCGNELETPVHLCKDCPFATEV